MKKLISKTMLAISVVFFIVIIIMLIKWPFTNTINIPALFSSIALAGLFLGLYRIIDLLEITPRPTVATIATVGRFLSIHILSIFFTLS